MIRRFAMWLVLRGPRLPGPLAPWLFGIAVGSRPHRVQSARATISTSRWWKSSPTPYVSGSEQNGDTTMSEEITSEITHTLEAIGGALVITITGLDTVPPGTHISFNILMPDANHNEQADDDTTDR